MVKTKSDLFTSNFYSNVGKLVDEIFIKQATSFKLGRSFTVIVTLNISSIIRLYLKIEF